MVFQNGMTRNDLQLVGDEVVDISNLDKLEPHKKAKCRISRDGKILHEFELLCRIDTEVEVEYLQDGGILQYVLKKLV
jgi:aconitate hydratase